MNDVFCTPYFTSTFVSLTVLQDAYAQKREVMTLSLWGDGRINQTTFCKMQNTGECISMSS